MGPEKRLPLALFLCFTILVGWRAITSPQPATGEGAEAAAAGTAASGEASDVLPGAPAPADGLPGEAADAAPAVGQTASSADSSAAGSGVDGGPPEASPDGEALPQAATVEPWSDWVELGAPGSKESAFVRFDSLGGSVAEIRLGGFFLAEGLSDEQREEMSNRVPVVQPAVTHEETLQTFMVRPQLSAKELLVSDLPTVHWEHRLLDDGVEFTHRDAGGLVLVKTIRQSPEPFQLDVALEVKSTTAAVAGKRATLGLLTSVGMRAEGQDSFYQEPNAVAAARGGDLAVHLLDPEGKPRLGSLVSGGRSELGFLGTHNKYFMMLARPSNELARAVLAEANWGALWDPDWVMDGGEMDEGFQDIMVEGVLELTTASRGASAAVEFSAYYGPKSERWLGAEDPFAPIFEQVQREDLGFFDGVASVILGFLNFLHGVVGNWGVAIIILTLCVRSLLFPLNRRMQTSMARHATKMKRVQPKIDAIKKKYESDPKRLRQEQARVFQEEGAMPPIGGCLPVFFQIPIFFGLFSALRVSFDLRQEPFFGWIKDLSQPDQLMRIDLPFPIVGPIEYLNLLPILMVVLWVGQQKVVPKPATDNEQARQMQKMMMWIPIMFGVFLYNYAAGLSLYMITTSAFGIMEYTVIRKIWPLDDSEKPRKKSRWMEKLENLQKQAVAQQEAQRKGGPARGGGGRKKR